MALSISTGQLFGDEGMWTFDNLPIDRIKETYGFKITPGFLKKVQLASVRFNDGGSGAFVSKDGLIITNHHVAMGQLQKMSSGKNDYVKKGFFTRAKSEEITCPDLELNILNSFENVTARVLKAIDGIEEDKAKNAKRKEEISKIEKESFDKTGLRSDVIELYEGGEYWLYRYKKYTDVRLVMAPELQAAAFGGDDDNFNYPRFALDFAFFRAYENGNPISSPDFLKWSKEDVRENELVIVSGHPGSTDRQKTLSQILYYRDYYYPEIIKILETKLSAYKEFSKKGKEEERKAKDAILGIENSLKSLKGEFNGLKAHDTIAKIEEKERSLKAVSEKKGIYTDKDNPWIHIQSTVDKLVSRHREYMYTGIGSSRLAGIALTIVRHSIEAPKPNEKRYEEFRDSNLESLKYRLLSPAPIYKDFDEVIFKTSIEQSLKNLSEDDEFIKTSIGSSNPSKLSKKLIAGTNLHKVEFRKELLGKSFEELKKVKDPLLAWVIKLEPLLRKSRDWYDDEIESIQVTEGSKLSKLKFSAFGKSIYPDATFTLRLSFGKVKGFTEESTIKIPFLTTFYGLFDRSESFGNKMPFQLSEKIADRKNFINLKTPLNFISTNDITGGNSGSPVINKKGEYVGLIFDGNSHSHIWSFLFSDEKGRSVSVHKSGIEEALRNIYKMDTLLRELGVEN